jgi:GH15 family glucan-1,4-alpha-glucosidase
MLQLDSEPARRAHTGTESDYPPIGDYALIGDCHGAALVSRAGSVDWCALGRFDADPVCCRILDARRGGFLAVQPAEPHSVTRAYVDGTNILRTTFLTETGKVEITDFMPVGRRSSAGTHNYTDLNAPGWLVRIAECQSGRVPIRIRYRPSVEFGRRAAELRAAPGEVASLGGPYLYHDLPDFAVDGDTARSERVLNAGDRHALVLTRTEAQAAHPAAAASRLEAVTRAFWEEWIAYCRYQGPHSEAVRRSALALKLLTYAPSGAIIAAPTTSLPERIGGVRNWDYRYCWLRDSAFTLYALAVLGYGGEGRRFSEFLARVCAVSYPELQIMYGIDAETDLREQILDHLSGYRDSRPVRVGNAAYRQRQIDVYGEVLDWAYLYRRLGGRIDAKGRLLLKVLADFVAANWREPDAGLWEMRAEPRQHVHGKIMSWVALDRALRLLGGDPLWETERDAIVADVRENGIDRRSAALVQAYGYPVPDAALLLTPLLGFPVSVETLQATVDLIERHLRDGIFVHRYLGDDGLPGDEGAFLICSFWLVDALLFLNRGEEAQALFQQLLDCGNDVGLFSEEFDGEEHALLGNFPQAFTHLGLIGAASHLELFQQYGPEALRGTHADRARRVVTATLGWRGIWAAMRASGRVGRLRSSKQSVMPIGMGG